VQSLSCGHFLRDPLMQVNSTALFVAALAQLLKEKPASASNFDILHAGGI